MKAKTLKIKFEPWDEFKQRAMTAVKKAVKQKEQAIDPIDTLTFSSVTAFQKFMTEQKYAILAAIYNLKPTSIYQLAKLIDRDFANVKRDCESLEKMGFIQLTEIGDAKGTKMPRLSFEYVIIEIHMPNLIYEHKLTAAVA